MPARFIAYRTYPFLLIAVIAVSTGSLAAQPVGPTQPVILEYAENLTGLSLPAGEEKIELRGNVQLRQGLVNITADRAIYYTAGDRAQLFGNVRIEQPGVVMTAPETDYNGGTGIATAPLGIVIQEDSGTLEAGYGEYHINRRISYFREGVKLYDSNIVMTALDGVYYSSERKAIFQGDVTTVSDSGTLNSDELTYWRDSQRSYAVGNVRLESLQDASVLTCDTLLNIPDTETFAYGNVKLISQKEQAELTGDTLRHLPDADYTIVTGSPKLVQVDSTIRPYVTSSDSSNLSIDSAAGSDSTTLSNTFTSQLDTIHRGDSIFSVRRDSTIITATILERFTGELKEFRATGDARLRRGTLEAVGSVARFLEDDEIITLGSGYPTSKPVTGDSPVASDSNDVVDTSASVDEQESDEESGNAKPEEDTVTVEGNYPKVDPVVWYEDSQLTGDTITVFLTQKKLRLIDVLGNAFAISKNAVPDRYDQLASERLLFNVTDDTVRSVRAEGAAASIYYIYDGDLPNGLNRSSGDTIVITFTEGRASRVGIYGPFSPLEGEVIPEQDVAGRESVYRLSGFEWQRSDETADADSNVDTNTSGPDSSQESENSVNNKNDEQTASDSATTIKDDSDSEEPR